MPGAALPCICKKRFCQLCASLQSLPSVSCVMPPRVDRGQGSAWKSSTHSFLFLASFDQLTHLLTVCFTSQAQRDIIFELRRIAFDAESDPSNAPGSGTEKRKAMYTKDYKMLGFTVSFPDTNTVDLLP